VSGSGISWAICRSAPRSRQITIPAPHHSVFYRPDALPATQPTASTLCKTLLLTTFWFVVYATMVTPQVAWITKTFAAYDTFELFVIHVDSLVTVQVARHTKSLVTHATFVRFLSGVYSHVSLKISGPTEFHVTHIARVRLLSAVNSAVLRKMTCFCKSLVTDSTLKSHFASVGYHVPVSPSSRTECLVTHLAVVWLASTVNFPRSARFSRLVIVGRLRDIIISDIIFSLYYKWLRFISAVSLSLKRRIETWICTT